MMFAAVHESAFGTKRHSLRRKTRSLLGA